ncbi:MAG: hypothetical protein ACTSVI_15680 [Promethearchaeota archaeon]
MNNTTYFVGFCSEDITPPLELNVRLGGYIRFKKYAKKVLYPLKANAICFRNPEDVTKSLILISCDLVGFQYRLGKVVRKIISRQTQVPISRIILHFTHSHSSPDTIGIFPNTLSNLFTFDVQYPVVKHIMKKMIVAGSQAFKNARIRAKIGFGMTNTINPPLAIRRRPPFEMIHDPIRFIKVCDENEKIIAILVNYQAHPTQLPQKNSDIHPEYPGMVVKSLMEKFPTLKFTSYFNGASGDVTIRGYKGYAFKRYRENATHDEAMKYALDLVESLGEKIASYVAAAIPQVKTEKVQEIRVVRKFVFPRIGRIKSIGERLKYYKSFRQRSRLFLKELENALRIGLLHDFYKFVNRRYLPMLNIIKNGRRVLHQTELFVIKINDITWFSSPGEPFFSYQKTLFDKIDNGKAFFSQMNETCGYIFPWSFYVKGGYEKFFSFDALFGHYMQDLFLNIINLMNEKADE